MDFLYYTPVGQTFSFMKENSGIVFTGTADPWVDTETVRQGCEEKKLPLTVISQGNHSLETGEVQRDLDILKQVMETSEAYIKDLCQETGGNEK